MIPLLLTVKLRRNIAIACALAIFNSSSLATAKPCELNVWAEGSTSGPAVNPRSLSPSERSTPRYILDAGQRLYEMDPKQLVDSLTLPADTKVIIHTERQLVGKQAEQTNSRLSSSDASCYIDWTFRPDATFGPTPSGSINALWIRNYGTLSFYSILKAYGSTGGPYISVKGVHQGRLPVLSQSEQKKPIYDTTFATRDLVENAVRKINNKLNGRPLTQGY